MAGKPRTRARLAAAAAAPPLAPIAEAVAEPAPAPTATRAPAHDARARVPARARELELPTRAHPPTEARPMSPGPRLRSAVDDAQAKSIEALARVMPTAFVLRVVRLVPVWCEGWCVDFPTEAIESVGALYEYLEGEWGGSRYKVTALGEGDVILNVSTLIIARPPRWRGKEIDRDKWEGRSDADRTRSLVATPAPSPADALVPVLTLLLEQQRATSTQHIDGLRDMMKQSGSTTTELLKQLVARANPAKTERGLVEQLQEVVQANAAFEQVRKAMGGGKAERRAAAPTGDKMKDALESALTSLMHNAFAPGAAAAAQQPGAPGGGQTVRPRAVRLVHSQPEGVAETSAFPEAIPESGQ